MDLNEQKAETEQVFREISQMETVPEAACINFQFVAEEDQADWDGFTEAAEALGYTVEWFDAEDEDEACVEITTAMGPLSLDILWAHEEKLTLMGAIYGFGADGWGFFSE
ncbi:MAG: ribonuclease E inhibitor RraB [Paracoccaceae bacterium]|nr:ribonuclease E inhibitor RraB [Paracoccaceae bacterium]